MSKPSVLILDDDEMWMARHERRLIQAGFRCFATQNSAEAIDLGRSETSIKFALIDEILFVTPVPLDENQRELQRWQGSGVIREINNLRRDIQYIIITSAPQLRSQGELPLFTRETSQLRRQTNVIDVMHKQDIETDPDHEYQWLIEEIFQRSQPTIDPTSTIKPRVLLGLGFDQTIFDSLADQLDQKRRSRLSISPLLKDLPNPEKVLNEFIDRATEQRFFIEAPGSKTLDNHIRIKPQSQSGQILRTLASRAELRQEIIIRETDYQYEPRSNQHQIDSDLDERSIADFAYDYSDGRKSQSPGVQIENRPIESRLKTAMHRLKQDLAKANVAAPEAQFTFTQQGYQPTFELGIFCYVHKPGKKQRP
jgi:hypothetical protein